MQYIEEIPVTALVSHTIAEDDAAAYNPATPYAVDVLVLYQHRVYKSLQAANTGHTPGVPDSLTWWLDRGPSNQWGAFDDELTTATSATGGFAFVLTPPQGIEGLAFLKAKGVTSITVQAAYGAEVLYGPHTHQMLDTSWIDNWWDYYYGDWPERTELVLLDLPGIPGATISVTVASDGEASVGMYRQGRVINIGEAQWKPTVGVEDYDTALFDKLGGLKLTDRGFAKTYEVQAELPSGRFDAVAKSLYRVLSKPRVWIAGDGLYDTLIIYGIGSWKLTLDNYSISYCQLSVKGLIE